MILQIGSQHLSKEEYADKIVGLIMRLFASPDRGTRMSLLENLSTFVDKLSKATVSDKLFPHVV